MDNGLNDRGRAWIHEANRLGMVINVSHASDDAISQAIDVSTDPVIATHHGLRQVNDIPRNMPDWLLKKLAAKGGVIGFQIGNEFHNRKVFDWVTAHAGKPFWDTKAIHDRAPDDHLRYRSNRRRRFPDGRHCRARGNQADR